MNMLYTIFTDFLSFTHSPTHMGRKKMNELCAYIPRDEQPYNAAPFFYSPCHSFQNEILHFIVFFLDLRSFFRSFTFAEELC